jgi:hypothetical protein
MRSINKSGHPARTRRLSVPISRKYFGEKAHLRYNYGWQAGSRYRETIFGLQFIYERFLVWSLHIVNRLTGLSSVPPTKRLAWQY